MSNCTPVRTRSCRFHTPLDDLLWERQQDRDARYIADEEAAKARQKRIASILQTFSFHLSEYETLFSFDRSICYQVGMEVTSQTDPRECYLVTLKLSEEDKEEFSVECQGSHCHWDESPFILQAVQTRVEQNRQQRLQQTA